VLVAGKTGGESTRQPPYRQIVDEIRRAIEAGELAEGDQIPSQSQMMTQFKVARQTVQKAVAALVAEGLAVTRVGAGVYVRRFDPITRESPARLARDRWGAGSAIQDRDTGPRVRAVDVAVDQAPPPHPVATALRLKSDAPALRRSRRFVVDDRTVQIATSWYPLDLAEGTTIAERDTGPGGAYARLAELGHGPVRFREVIRCRMPQQPERDVLELPPGTPVAEITRYAFDDAGRCVEVNEMVLDGTAYVLAYEFEA
jgi:GntR family transcriptional regulator